MTDGSELEVQASSFKNTENANAEKNGSSDKEPYLSGKIDNTRNNATIKSSNLSFFLLRVFSVKIKFDHLN